MPAISMKLRRQPFSLNTGIVVLLFMVCLGLSSEKVEASIIFPPASPLLSESPFDESAADDFGISHSVVRSLIESITRTDDFFGNWFSHDLINTRDGASGSSQSQAPTKLARQPVVPSDDDLQLISMPAWMVLVGFSASDRSGCSSTAVPVPVSDLSGRYSQGLTAGILCVMPVQIRLHWLRSRDLVHIPKVHVSELLRPPQVSGVLS